MTKTSDLFGRLAVLHGHLDQGQVDHLRRMAAKRDQPLDEYCLEHGTLDRAVVLALRKEARKAEERRKFDDKYQIGGIAVELGYLDHTVLKRALRRQRKLREREKISARLGELCLARGDLSLKELRTVLQTQSERLGRCDTCDEVFRLSKPGRARCPHCNKRLATPEMEERAETVSRARKLKAAMLGQFDRKQMLLDASDAVEKLQQRQSRTAPKVEPEKTESGHRVVAEDNPAASGGLTILDLGSEPDPAAKRTSARKGKKSRPSGRKAASGGLDSGDAIGSARVAFADFYQDLQEDQAGQPGEGAAPAIKTLDQALMQAKAVKAIEINQQQAFPIFRVTALVLCLMVSVFVGWLVWVSQNDRVAHRAALAEQQAGPAAKPDPMAALQPGMRVLLHGVIRGGAGNVHATRSGMCLVLRGFGPLWVEDTSGSTMPYFKMFSERHGQRMRTSIRVEGVLQLSAALDRSGIPEDAAPRLWVRIDPETLRLIRHSEMAAASESIATIAAAVPSSGVAPEAQPGD